jgi:hypothetical protein
LTLTTLADIVSKELKRSERAHHGDIDRNKNLFTLQVAIYHVLGHASYVLSLPEVKETVEEAQVLVLRRT